MRGIRAPASGARGALGSPLVRREDARVLRGATSYLDDIDPAGVAHVAFVRSPYARAVLGRIEPQTGQAGTIAMLTAADLDGLVQPFPLTPVEGLELASEPHPVLAEDEVRYIGQPVAAVIADSRALAEDAAERAEIDYRPLEAVVDPGASRDLLMRWSRATGDVAGAFGSAAHVVAGAYSLPRLAAAPIEPRGCLVEHDRERDQLTVWCSAQDPHRPRAQLAHILRRPAETIRVIVPDVGGAFGSKGVIAPEVAVVAAAAIALGRRLKWTEDRRENFLAAYQGRGIAGELSLALDGDGRMLALRARLLADLGGYLLTTSAIPPHTAATLITGCYDVPAAEVSVVGVRTNKAPSGPYRGAGRPDAAYMLERLVDDAAKKIEIDRIELRRRNLIRSFPHRTALGLVYDSGDYARCLDLALELQRAAPVRRARGGRVAGRGLALFVERAAGAWESASAELGADGRLIVRSSASPHGQGHDTTFAQIAAQRLAIPLDLITLRFGDSAEVPPGVGTFGSRSVAVAGSAVALALDGLLDSARPLAAALLGVRPADVAWAGGKFRGGERSLSLEELVRAVAASHGLPPQAAAELPLRGSARFDSERVFSSGAYAAAVEIERATGRLHVLGLAAVDDAGTVINPLLARGQVIGGAVQGLGECLVEEVIYDEIGQLRTASLMDYGLLSAPEIPPIATGTVATPSPLNPLGAKGVGEGGAIGALAAVANAVADAVGRHVDPPFTGEKLWRALR